MRGEIQLTSSRSSTSRTRLLAFRALVLFFVLAIPLAGVGPLVSLSPVQTAEAAPSDGRVVYYDWESGSGATVQDRSGNANDGTMNGNATYTASALSGKWALSQIQTDEHVAPPKNMPFSGTNGWAHSAEIEWNGGTGQQKISMLADGIHTWIHIENGILKVRAGENTGTGKEFHHVSTPVEPDKKYQVVGDYNSTHLNLYVNGSLVNSTDVPDDFTQRSAKDNSMMNNTVGSQTHPSTGEKIEHFNGTIDEWMAWDRSVSPSEVDTLYSNAFDRPANPRYDPIAHYDMESGSGTTVTDRSGNGNDATLKNSSGWSTDAGNGSYSITSPNNDSWADVPDTIDISGSAGVTFSTWIYSEGPGDHEQSAYHHAAGEAELGINQNDKYFFTIHQNGGDGWEEVNGTLAAYGSWTHLVGVWTGKEIKIYQDGELVNTKSVPTGHLNDADPQNTVHSNGLLGHPDSTDGTIHQTLNNGKADEIEIYDVEVPEGQIDELYSQASHTVEGEVVTVEDGAAVPNSHVEVWAVSDGVDVKPGQTLEERQAELLDQASDPIPSSWNTNLDLQAKIDTWDQQGSVYPAIHHQSAWYNELEIAGYGTGMGTADLSDPTYQLDPNEKYTLSLWDASTSDGYSDDVIDRQLTGSTTSGTVVVEKLGPGGTVVDRQELETEKKYETTWGTYPVAGKQVRKEHEVVEFKLQSGFYRVSPKNSTVSYVFVVGDSSQLAETFEADLKSDAGQLSSRAQALNERVNNKTFKRIVVQADSSGQFKADVPEGYETVAVTAFKGPGLLQDYQKPTLADLRSEVKAQDYNGSIYLSTEPNRVNPPASGVQVQVREINSPTLMDIQDYLDRLSWLEDLIDTDGFAELESLFTDPINNKEDAIEARDRLRDTVLGNSELRERWEEIAAERGIPTDLYRDDLSQAELQEQIDALLAATSRDHTATDGDSTPGTTGSTQPTYDTSPTTGGGTTINIEIPTGSQLNETEGAQSVVCQKPDGATRWVNSSNVSIDSGVLGDTVLVEDVVGNQTAGCNYILMAPGEEEGVVREEVNVENPAFDGTIPGLASINLNTQRPGPDETVTVSATPTETSSFKNIQGATVYGPDGSEVTTSLKNGKVHFTTAGAGSHLVKLNVTDGDRGYVESFRVKAGNESINYPASIRVHNGVLGRTVLASDGVKSGRISVENGGSVARVTAEVDGENVPPEIHVHARDLTGLEQELTVTAVRESDGSRIQRGSRVKLHLSRLSEGAHVRVNGHPITTDGTSWGKVEHFSDSTLITTNLRDGSIGVTANNNPDVLDSIGWWLDVQLEKIPSSPLAIVPVGLVETVAAPIMDVSVSAPVGQLVSTADASLATPALQLAGDVALGAPDPATLGVPDPGVIA